jgi:hypothetical protein
MPRNERHVVSNPDGGWNVVAPRAQRPSAHVDTSVSVGFSEEMWL